MNTKSAVRVAGTTELSFAVSKSEVIYTSVPTASCWAIMETSDVLHIVLLHHAQLSQKF